MSVKRNGFRAWNSLFIPTFLVHGWRQDYSDLKRVQGGLRGKHNLKPASVLNHQTSLCLSSLPCTLGIIRTVAGIMHGGL